jgi:hypothetical protein
VFIIHKIKHYIYFFVSAPDTVNNKSKSRNPVPRLHISILPNGCVPPRQTELCRVDLEK